MKRFSVIPLAILWLSFTALAQNQPAPADKTDDFIKILSAAYEKLQAAPYREKIQQVIKTKDGLITITQTTTTEFIPPDRKRRVETLVHTYSKTMRIVDTIGFPSDTRKEVITIGNLEFIQEGKSWKKTEKPGDKDADVKSEKPVERDYIINFLGRKTVEGKEFDVYEMVNTKNPSQPKERFWINVGSGLPVRREFDFLRTEDATTQVEITYEQDASIRIEAPKLN